jgi:uncharacterized protein involved in exopolysaccharide biosynthesis
MPESFEAFRYLDHLRARWRLIAVACAAAAGLAFLAALLTPSEYTATARIMIEPPAGTDPRVAVAVSPVYLESLKSYELLASGDRLFLDSLDHFKLPHSGPIDKLKRSVVKVSIPRNTRILEISATLRNPGEAQALALYIAERTVKLAREVTMATERDLLADAKRQWDETRAKLERAERSWAQVAEEPASAAPEHLAKVDAAQAEREAARDSFAAAEKRLQVEQTSTGYRGERLNIIDPGVVPERPSRPNVPLMVLAAILVALSASLLYVTFEFNYSLERAAAPRPVASLARVKSVND